MEDFSSTSSFPKGCNSSFIVFIPKIVNAKFVSDFRPISLIVYQYKIISTLLANSLSKVIGRCVAGEHSVFIEGINILDGPLMLNETMEWYRTSNRSLLIFKVDFEKVDDFPR